MGEKERGEYQSGCTKPPRTEDSTKVTQARGKKVLGMMGSRVPAVKDHHQHSACRMFATLFGGQT